MQKKGLKLPSQREHRLDGRGLQIWRMRYTHQKLSLFNFITRWSQNDPVTQIKESSVVQFFRPKHKEPWSDSDWLPARWHTAAGRAHQRASRMEEEEEEEEPNIPTDARFSNCGSRGRTDSSRLFGRHRELHSRARDRPASGFRTRKLKHKYMRANATTHASLPKELITVIGFGTFCWSGHSFALHLHLERTKWLRVHVCAVRARMWFSSELQEQQEPVEREGEERNRGEREGGKEGGRGEAMHGQRGQTWAK